LKIEAKKGGNVKCCRQVYMRPGRESFKGFDHIFWKCNPQSMSFSSTFSFWPKDSWSGLGGGAIWLWIDLSNFRRAYTKAHFPLGKLVRAKRKTNLGNVIGERKNSPRKSWISSYIFTVHANKFAQWKMGLTKPKMQAGLADVCSVSYTTAFREYTQNEIHPLCCISCFSLL
jgi:hypothetical protein